MLVTQLLLLFLSVNLASAEGLSTEDPKRVVAENCRRQLEQTERCCLGQKCAISTVEGATIPFFQSDPDRIRSMRRNCFLVNGKAPPQCLLQKKIRFDITAYGKKAEFGPDPAKTRPTFFIDVGTENQPDQPNDYRQAELHVLSEMAAICREEINYQENVKAGDGQPLCEENLEKLQELKKQSAKFFAEISSDPALRRKDDKGVYQTPFMQQLNAEICPYVEEWGGFFKRKSIDFKTAKPDDAVAIALRKFIEQEFGKNLRPADLDLISSNECLIKAPKGYVDKEPPRERGLDYYQIHQQRTPGVF
jgi:hypothetical protein